MNAPGFIQVLEAGLLSYLSVNPSVKFMQDNDPKHTSNAVKDWLESKGVEYIRRVVKPKHKDELVAGILEFWKTVNVQKCKKYIGHLKKVVPKVIEMRGGPTGY